MIFEIYIDKNYKYMYIDFRSKNKNYRIKNFRKKIMERKYNAILNFKNKNEKLNRKFLKNINFILRKLEKCI